MPWCDMLPNDRRYVFYDFLGQDGSRDEFRVCMVLVLNPYPYLDPKSM